MSAGLTPRQRACLSAIERLTVDGVAPTFDEIKAAIGSSSKGEVHRLTTQLVERGHLRKLPGRARALEVVKDVPLSKRELGERIIADAKRAGSLIDRTPQAVLRMLADHIERSGATA